MVETGGARHNVKGNLGIDLAGVAYKAELEVQPIWSGRGGSRGRRANGRRCGDRYR